MQGIALLREVLEEDPDNEQATFNLGILSIQSGQYDRAVERFEKLATLYPENLQAQFYLGLSYLETGKRAKARKQFEKVKELDADPAVQAAVDGYLEESLNL
jgi:Flp pilus assembly protein TadD